MKQKLSILALCVPILTLLTLAACGETAETPSVSSSGEKIFLPMSTATIEPCSACAQATMAAAQTQEKSNTDIQAAATATIVLANAQATLNSVNATTGAVQTQEKNNSNIIAAQITATAAIASANVQATLNSAAATQNAAITQNAIQQTQIVGQATMDAQATANQQYKDKLAAGTQTALTNRIVMLTQVAAATSEWVAAQASQHAAQEQTSLTFAWMLCLPGFVLTTAGLFLWGSWRWLRTEQQDKRSFENPADRLPLPGVRVIDHRLDDATPYLETHVVDRRDHQLTNSDDQVRGWLDEVKHKLLSDDKKDENENTDS